MRWAVPISSFPAGKSYKSYSCERASFLNRLTFTGCEVAALPLHNPFLNVLCLRFDVKDFGDKDLRVPSPVRSPADG